MRLFSEVKMRSYSVLEKMNNEIPEQNQERSRLAAKFETGWNHLDDRSSQHKAGAQGDKITKVRMVPMPLNDDGTAENVGGSGRKTQQHAEEDWVHYFRRIIADGLSNASLGRAILRAD
jgi:hypothetical protein